jgi:hypothetical protein
MTQAKDGGDFFVILNTQAGGLVHMSNGDDGLATFKTQAEAIKAGRENLLGNHFGFAVFDAGDGEHY